MHNILSSGSLSRLSPLLIGLMGIAFLTLTWINLNFSYLPMPDLISNIGLKSDPLAYIMLLAVSALATIIMSYSLRYLKSDLTRTRFLVQIFSTIVSVIFFIFASNLFTAFIAWQWIGFNLYQLLNHYHYQSDANRAAKKKYIVNRIGDVCFLVAIVLCYHFYGTTEYAELANTTSKVIALLGISIKVHTLILGLVFMAIMTKSAQFPFHFWLPDTMQTPTPVSALMHAGVINAGGILVARLSPLLPQTTVLPYIILLVGISTMTVGTILKSAQPDVKKQLAYSTMGQMGYMLMQSALGCFAAAVFHLIAHGFYKAALFLNAGSELYPSQLNFRGCCLRDSHRSHVLYAHSCDSNARRLPEKSSVVGIVSNQTQAPNHTFNQYGQFFTAAVLSMVIVGLGILLFDPEQISILLLTFITIAIHQMTTTAVKCEGMALRLVALSFVQGILLAYFWILTVFESWIDIPVIRPISLHLEYIISSIVILIYFYSEVHSRNSIGFSKTTVLSLRLRELFNIEKHLRRYLLNPIRSTGDYLNKYLLCSFSKSIISIILMGFAILVGITQFYDHPNISREITHILAPIILIALLMGNRAPSLKALVFLLGITHTCLIVILDQYMQHFPIELILTYLSNFIGLWWLINQGHNSNIKQNAIVGNHLTLWGFYLTFSLFLMIGIPGSASFILWYSLISQTINAPHIMISMMIFNVLLAIVILHALQDYAFNQDITRELSSNKRLKAHALFIPIIFINVFLGIFSLTDWI
ncbi:MAG: proton-conducting transporter membrane subunit [Gammaproteobacteria bacterium]